MIRIQAIHSSAALVLVVLALSCARNLRPPPEPVTRSARCSEEELARLHRRWRILATHDSRVVVEIDVLANGIPARARIAQSTGDEITEQLSLCAALGTKYPPPRAGGTKVTVRFLYRLTGRTGRWSSPRTGVPAAGRMKERPRGVVRAL